VEPSAQNLAWHSHLWISANNWANTAVTVVTGTSGTTDPFGTNLANAISPTSGSSAHIAQSNTPTTISYTSGTIYTQSAFFKQGTGNAGRYVQMTFPGVGNSFTQLGYANFDLQLGTVTVVTGTTADTNRSARIENYGNGWYRCQLTATANVSAGGAGVAAILITASGSTRAPSFAGTTTDILYGFGAQLETGSVATSYIPTITAPITRNAEVISVTGAVSGCIGQTEGTMYAEVVNTLQTSYSEGYVARLFADANNEVWIRKEGGGNTYTVRWRANSQNTTFSSVAVPNGVSKIAFAYKSGDTALYLNGSQVGVTNTDVRSFAIGPNSVAIGSTSTGAYFNDRIRAVALYTTRLTNAELAALTTP
jgi:hypothetical protein